MRLREVLMACRESRAVWADPQRAAGGQGSSGQGGAAPGVSGQAVHGQRAGRGGQYCIRQRRTGWGHSRRGGGGRCAAGPGGRRGVCRVHAGEAEAPTPSA